MADENTDDSNIVDLVNATKAQALNVGALTQILKALSDALAR